MATQVRAASNPHREAIGTEAAVARRGKAAISQARLAYQLFRSQFSGRRWAELARQGARPQPPLWAPTSTKNRDYPDTLYVDSLIGPDTVNTLPEPTIEAFKEHGTLRRTIDAGVGAAAAVLEQIEDVGVDMADVGRQLEEVGVRSFHESFQHVLESLDHKRSRDAGH